MIKHISQNSRQIGKEHKVIWSTDNPKVFIETWTESKRVDISTIEKEILKPLTDEQYIELGKASYHVGRSEEEINTELEQYG